MIKYLTTLSFLLLAVTGAAHANAVKTSGQAVGVCKTHIKENVPGATSIKLSKVRTLRENHIITLAVRSDSGRQKTTCTVNRKDGSIALSN